ncbi:pentatricopeptide repeat-containing protein At2g03880, mitochondrial isoform X1 [Elaeis guineensis]|uniref:Pentatricopeptide repeat-containing protein At3g24000, mitochondrial isoform X1 n=2 Tax=Elaeis guineensis var. tenera TaxID=51953 RepID=A0A6I9RF94_ELAGV|nr:pentatricopeptide repeat-containing protein At3g24000, mitochondrial isoform X1 [Elaeis guineensis]
MYFRFGRLETALKVFDHMPQRNDASWNTAISGCVRVGSFAKAVELFREMREDGIEPNKFVLASLLTACNRWAEMVGKGIEIHAFVLKIGMMSNVYVGTALLHLYGGYGFLSDAQRLFQDMPERNVVSWTALMVSVSTNGYPQEALKAYWRMRREGVVCNQNSFTTAISSCGLLEDEKLSLQVIAHVVVTGFETDVSVANSLITLFGNLGRIGDAECIFNHMEQKDTISWNSMISAYSREGMHKESLQLFSGMRHGNIKPDTTTFSSLITACSCLDHLKWGKGLHALSVKDGLDLFVSAANALVNMYSTTGKYEEAEVLFHDMPKRDLISWNSMISSYVQSGQCTDALKLVAQQIQTEKEINHVTFANALAACSSPKALLDGKTVHALTIHIGLQENLLVGNALITMYGKCNAMREAGLVFQTMPDHDVVTFNALIGGHAENEEQREAVLVYNWMREAGITANYITMVNILGACFTPNDLLKYGKPLHAHVVSTGFESDEYVKNSLITMYAKCDDLDSSAYIFDGLGNKTAVSWNAMIASKARHGHGEDALKLFMEMQHVGIALDQFSLTSGLAASTSLASLEEGQQLHCLTTKLGFDSDIHVINAAMDMYGKCGKMDDMLKLLPEPTERSQQSWNILISGHARHGSFGKAEDMFKQMLSVGRKPDYVTLVSLLSACNHAGLVDKGIGYYNAMTSKFGISPRIEHCVCMVDLLGRSGRLVEAERFIENMPVSPNDLIWRSLLSSSRTYRNLDIGRKAAQRLLELDPLDDSAYVLLSNVYATNGRWEDVDKLRMHMKSINLKKRPACSWIKVKNEVNSFGIGDKSHPQALRIYSKLEEILQMVKQVGYVADTSFALHDTDEEQKEHNLWSHSEKLALAFGLLNVPEGSTIRVFKNLRVCGDCHMVYKLVSKAVDREIVLRDAYRFHHFTGGECSCSDYW